MHISVFTRLSYHSTMQESPKIILLTLLIINTISQQYVESLHTNNTLRSLTRKKRFLVFPEGSSLQLVYCLTIPSLGMGNIFTIGWTAALAWELPHEPLHTLRKKLGNTKRVDKKQPLKSGGWTIETPSASDYNFMAPNSYSTIDRFLSNPGYSKIRYDAKPNTSYREYLKGKYVDHRPVYDAWSLRSPPKQASTTKPVYQQPLHYEIHRRTRRDLYSKIEKFLEAQRQDGKACVLKAICEVSKTPNQTGTFMEEIIKAIFRIKPYRNIHDLDEFDIAADEGHNCTEKYPRCTGSIWKLMSFE